MVGRSPSDAYRAFIIPMRRALGCITDARLTFPGNARSGLALTVSLNSGDPVRLRGESVLFFTSQQRFEIIRTDVVGAPYRLHTLQYTYEFAIDVTPDHPGGTEVLSFHWTPESLNPGEKRFGHVHIKSPMLAAVTPIAPGRFSTVHIPTDRLCLEQVIRFAIEDLGVVPLRRDWEMILSDGEATWRVQRTR